MEKLKKYLKKIFYIIKSKIFSNIFFKKIIFPNVTFGNGVQITGIQDVKIGSGSCIGDNVWINTNHRGKGTTLKIGNCVLIGRNSVCSSASKIEIGDYTFTGSSVLISNSLHLYDDIEKLYIEGIKDCGQLVIEENCWISFGAVIYGSITVGRGSIIGAHSVVTKNVPPFSVIIGNPQKIFKMYNTQTKKWENTKNQKDIQKILNLRKRYPIPTREEYLNILIRNANIKNIDPLCAGRSHWI